MPVRAPEIRANDNSASELDGDNYAITVHAAGIKLVIERYHGPVVSKHGARGCHSCPRAREVRKIEDRAGRIQRAISELSGHPVTG